MSMGTMEWEMLKSKRVTFFPTGVGGRAPKALLRLLEWTVVAMFLYGAELEALKSFVRF